MADSYKEHYDIIVIGSGPGGMASSFEAMKYGAKVLVIEKKHDENDQILSGGTCLFRGCMPTKAMIHLSKEKGMTWKKLSEERNSVVNQLALHSQKQSQSAKDIDYIVGKAKLVTNDKVAIFQTEESIRTFTADNIILAGGSLPIIPEGWDETENCEILTSDSILQTEKLNDEIVVVGGGYIGCEYATIFSNLGKKVTIVEATKQIVPTEDKDCVREVMKSFQEKGAEVLLETKFNPEDKKWKGKQVLVAIGRKPNINIIDGKVGVEVNEKGQVVVNNKMQTNISNIYAVGDLVDLPFRLAHVAAQEGRIAARNIMKSELSKSDRKNKKVEMKYDAIPSTVFTSPLIMSVGSREKELKEEGLKENVDYVVGREWMRANGFAYCVSQTCGFFKVIAEKKTGKILGCSFVANGENNIDIHEIVLAIEKEMTLYDIVETSHFHPSSIEAIRDGCLNALKNI